MLILVYTLSLVALLYYVFKVPNIIPDQLWLNKETPFWTKGGVVCGVLITAAILFYGIVPSAGYSSSNLAIPFILLFTTTTLFFGTLLEISLKIKNYYTNTYNKVMQDSEDVQIRLNQSKSKLKEIEQREYKLVEKEKFFKDYELRKVELINLEKSNAAKEKRLTSIIQEELTKKELLLQLKYEQEIRAEKDRLFKTHQNQIEKVVVGMNTQMNGQLQQNKLDLLSSVLDFNSTEDNNFYEMQKTQEQIEQSKQEVNNQKYLLEIDKKMADMGQQNLDIKNTSLEIKKDQLHFQTDIKLLDQKFSQNLEKEYLERKHTNEMLGKEMQLQTQLQKSELIKVSQRIEMLDVQTKASLVEMNSNLNGRLNQLEIMTKTVYQEVNSKINDLKLQFGKEIMRIDGQQQTMLNELEKYYLKNQQFVEKCKTIAMEARAQNLEGKQIYHQVELMRKQQLLESSSIEQQLKLSLDKVAIKEQQMANTVGESMLKIKQISDEQYCAMKELSLEKKDLDVLWREKNIEHEMNLQEVRHQKTGLDHTRQLLQQEKSAFSDTKNNAMENARLTHRSFMQEQEHLISLHKVQNSGGWLSRWAKAIEHNLAK